MPEGPSIVILKEAAAKFSGKTVRNATGNSSLDLERMKGRRVHAVKSWGKHFLIVFSRFSLRVHMLLFGSYRIDDTKPGKTPRVSLEFDNGVLNIYASSVKYIEGAIEDAYDWRADVMDSRWDPKLARKRLKLAPKVLVCDVLLDQDIFAGVGNIIKNEVLFRTGVHPGTTVGDLPPRKLGELVKQARLYSFDFLEWKKLFVLRQHWQVHRKKKCPTCGQSISKSQMGVRKRVAYFCTKCQVRY